MAMLYRSGAAGVLAVLVLAAWTTAARAGDTVLLKGGVSAPTVTLALTADNDDADTDLVAYHRGWGGGFHHGYGGGYHHGYGGGYHHGYGGYHNAGYRYGYGGYHHGYGGYHSGGYRYGWGGYHGGYRYGGGGYYPYYRNYYSYYPRYYDVGYGNGYGYSPYYDYSPPVYYTPYYCPINLGVSSAPYVLPGATVIPPAGVTAPAPTPVPTPAPAGGGPYIYDGGPANPVPMPKADPTPAPSAAPKTVVPLPGERAVSLPAREPAKYQFAAYGEQAGRIAPSLATPYTDTVVTKGEPKKSG